MKLTQAEANSPLWDKLRQHFEARLAELRAKNDSDLLDAIKTSHLRGRLASVKEILALDRQEPAPETQADDGE